MKSYFNLLAIHCLTDEAYNTPNEGWKPQPKPMDWKIVSDATLVMEARRVMWR